MDIPPNTAGSPAQFTWTLRSGPTPTFNTGPNQDNSGNGLYAFIRILDTLGLSPSQETDRVIKKVGKTGPHGTSNLREVPWGTEIHSSFLPNLF